MLLWRVKQHQILHCCIFLPGFGVQMQKNVAVIKCGYAHQENPIMLNYCLDMLKHA